MKTIRLSIIQMINNIRRDMMLIAVCLAPILAGLIFKFVIPFIEIMLTDCCGVEAVLSPYYELIDVFYSMISPIMFCFAAAMIVLEEKDEKTAVYLFITPLGKWGYLLVRFGLPSFTSTLINIILLPIFKLSQLSLIDIVFLAVTGTLQGVIIALLIVTLSSNKLEGMAVTKLSTLIVVGAVIPFFVKDKLQYLLAPLPSFWIGKAILENNILYMLPSMILSAACIVILVKKYLEKL